MRKFLAAIFLIGAIFVIGLRHVNVVHAADSIVEQIGCDTALHPNPCGVADFINLFVYLSKWGMSILAILATGMMVFGGYQFLTAAGRSSKVDEGKKIINGTIIGVIISLTAYIIINTAFAAISGNQIVTLNPFGVVANVFVNDKNQNNTINGQTITRPFSGKSNPSTQKNGSGVKECRQAANGWKQDCDSSNLGVHCSDPENPPVGAVTNLQTILNDHGCACGDTDGCYGANTVSCVRIFQLSNNLPATGVVDTTTKAAIDSGKSCNSAGKSLDTRLPSTTTTSDTNPTLGCCIVKESGLDKYCVDNQTSGTCKAIGSGNELVPGRCGPGTETSNRCGFCSNVQNPTTSTTTNPLSSCFWYASPFWCTTVVGGTFNTGRSDGRCVYSKNALLDSFPTTP